MRETWVGGHVQKIFETFGRQKDRIRNEEVQDATEDAYETFASVPKETLQEIIDSFGTDLEPALREMLGRFMNSTVDDIDASELLLELLQNTTSWCECIESQMANERK